MKGRSKRPYFNSDSKDKIKILFNTVRPPIPSIVCNMMQHTWLYDNIISKTCVCFCKYSAKTLVLETPRTVL